MNGCTNVAEAPEFMVSRRQPNPAEKANRASIPGPKSPLANTLGDHPKPAIEGHFKTGQR